MNDTSNNYLPWIIGAVVVLLIGAFLFMQPTGEPTSGTNTIPSETGDNTLSGTVVQPGATGTPSRTAGKPVVATTGFASVASTTAAAVGTVVPMGAATTYWFEYGTTTALGNKSSTVSLPASFTQQGVSLYLTGLKPATQYYFRLGAQNSYGTVYGSQYSLITAPAVR